MTKELLFTITAADCVWEYMRGTGPGGQKRNKTESKVRCTHRDSGAVGESDLTRSQHQNKALAFRKMAESAKFKAWHRMECARRAGTLISVEEQLQEKNLKVEGRVDGKWVPIEQTVEQGDEA
jgi:protein subunit release factor B